MFCLKHADQIRVHYCPGCHTDELVKALEAAREELAIQGKLGKEDQYDPHHPIWAIIKNADQVLLTIYERNMNNPVVTDK